MNVEDKEIAAMESLRRSLEPLESEAVRRVLEWAKDRFLDETSRTMNKLSEQNLLAQIKQITERAQQLGVTDRELMHALSAMREAQGLAPVEVREEIAAVETKIAKSAK